MFILLELKYPLDSITILRKKKSYKKRLLLDSHFTTKKIAILGGSTTSEVKNILELFLLNIGIKPIFYESEYNKYYEDALFGNDDLNAFLPDLIYIHTTQINITNFPQLTDSDNDIQKKLDNEIARFGSIWASLVKYNCPIIQNNFDFPLHRSLGNLDGYDIHGKTNYINRLNSLFALNAQQNKNLYIHDINYLSSYIGILNWFDLSLWYQAKYALSLAAIPELAFNLSKIMGAIWGASKKCLVLDLDNTCWGGVIGDDGLNGIQIGNETPIAESFTAFQKYVIELKDRGITLAVCSKNDEVNAKEGFSHPDSILKFEDFAAFKSNWEPKHLNISAIAQEINIGMDSLVFIDDNPVERDIVSSQLNAISVPNVGDEVVDFINHIDRNGYFEPINLLKDDLQRNQYYKQNKDRDVLQLTFKTYSDFLKSLDMKAEIATFKPVYLERITQLTNKTNQFNLTTKRYTIAQIEQLTNDDNYIKIYGKLTDKFGDNGLVAVTIANILENQCHIDLWIMSCRVLKRDMEVAMMCELVKECEKSNVSEIIGRYYETKKNNMVSNLYADFGFEQIGQEGNDTVWKLNIADFNSKKLFIEVKR